MKVIRYQNPLISVRPARFVNPWSRLEDEIDQAMSSAFSGLWGDASPAAEYSHPRVDLYEDKENFHVRVELPGLKRDDIQVELGEGVLTLSAERKRFGPDGEAKETSRFSRSLSVPARVQEDNIGARYEDGILTVTLPKAEEVKPKRIAVQIK